jgi:hypothetical protein
VTQPVLFAVEDGEHSLVSFGGSPQCGNDFDRGGLSEIAFEMEAIRRGWLVAAARGSGRDFDYIVKRPHLARPVSVQVKYARWTKNTRGCWHYAIKCRRRLGAYSASAFDILAAHLGASGKWVFYTRQEIGNRTGTTYLPPESRKTSVSRAAPAARNPDNWELLDQVASPDSQESLGIGQPLSDPTLHSPPIA